MRLLFVLLVFTSLLANAQSESPSKKIGLELLQLFKKDSLTDIQKLRIPVADVSVFLNRNSIDTVSAARYISKYPEISKSIVEKAIGFRKDAANFPIKWESVRVMNYRENATNFAPADKPGSQHNIIEFKSGRKRYVLFFETVEDKDGRWYLGNFIDLRQATLGDKAP